MVTLANELMPLDMAYGMVPFQPSLFLAQENSLKAMSMTLYAH